YPSGFARTRAAPPVTIRGDPWAPASGSDPTRARQIFDRLGDSSGQDLGSLAPNPNVVLDAHADAPVVGRNFFVVASDVDARLDGDDSPLDQRRDSSLH